MDWVSIWCGPLTFQWYHHMMGVSCRTQQCCVCITIITQKICLHILNICSYVESPTHISTCIFLTALLLVGHTVGGEESVFNKSIQKCPRGTCLVAVRLQMITCIKFLLEVSQTPTFLESTLTVTKKKKWIAVMAPFCGHILVSKPSVFRETLQYILTFYLSFWLSLSVFTSLNFIKSRFLIWTLDNVRRIISGQL